MYECMYVCYGGTFIKSKMTSNKQRNRKAEETLTLKFLLAQVNSVFRPYNTKSWNKLVTLSSFY
jgi:hypothetical protein